MTIFEKIIEIKFMRKVLFFLSVASYVQWGRCSESLKIGDTLVKSYKDFYSSLFAFFVGADGNLFRDKFY